MAAVAATADGAVRIPVPHQPLCGQRVLVMERLDGTPLGEAGPVVAERGLDREKLARELLASLLDQVMLHGVFHADPHPGNVLVLADGRLGLLDFGSVGRLDTSVRSALARLLLAMDRGDPLAASDALLEVMLRPDEVDQQRLERALGVLEGTLTRLAPGLDLVAEARSFAARHGPAQVGPDAARQAVTEELTTLMPMLRRLPRRVERIAGAAENGRLSVHVRLFADERDRRHVTGLLNQVLLTILAATAGIMAVLLLGTGGGPSVTARVGLYQLLGYNLLVVCAILALRVLVLIFRPNR